MTSRADTAIAAAVGARAICAGHTSQLAWEGVVHAGMRGCLGGRGRGRSVDVLFGLWCSGLVTPNLNERLVILAHSLMES